MFKTVGFVQSLGDPVGEHEVDAYKILRFREVVGDGVEHDHISSYAVLKAAGEEALGRTLTPEEAKTLYKNATAIEIPREIHMAGRTYGGKNTAAQIQLDAADLCGAVCRDTEKLRQNLLSRGYEQELVDQAIQRVISRNKAMGVIQ